jgi:FMN phosphatase YigB (HAD superfamily)|tara:strand:- start:1321 stop:1905 length:585 start_codon:yes stop_codon:yes gene_type:complete
MDKRIILDCDGVLLDWAYAFDVWMVEHGYSKISNTDQYYEQTRRYGISQVEAVSQIKKFNESGCVGFIPAFRDSVEYVTKLSELGWKFEVISCLDKDKYAQKLRQKNLLHLFGDVFDFIDCALDFTVGKEQYLLDRYKGKNYYWIEDSVDHAESGKRVGLNSIVMDHPYNKEWDGPRVKNWKEIYQIITHDSTH